MKIPIPKTFIEEEDWDAYLAEHCSVLSNLLDKGKQDEFDTLKYLTGLDYDSFWDEHDEDLFVLMLSHQTSKEIREEIDQQILNDITSIVENKKER